MRKLALILATGAVFALAAPAFAVESGTAAHAGTPLTQTNATVKAKGGTDAMAKVVHHRRGVNKLVRHDRGLHRGFTHSRHYGYGKKHHHSVHSKSKVAR
jgi:hypothetical protein